MSWGAHRWKPLSERLDDPDGPLFPGLGWSEPDFDLMVCPVDGSPVVVTDEGGQYRTVRCTNRDCDGP